MFQDWTRAKCTKNPAGDPSRASGRLAWADGPRFNSTKITFHDGFIARRNDEDKPKEIVINSLADPI